MAGPRTRIVHVIAAALIMLGLESPAVQAQARSDQERLLQLETEQQYIKQAIKDTQDMTKYLLTTFAALMVVIQVAATLVQARKEERAFRQQAAREDVLDVRRVQREDELETKRSQREQKLYNSWTQRENDVEKRRTEREDRLDSVTTSSVQSVKNVLDVVSSTFEERRKAEKEGRDATQKFNAKLDELSNTISTLNGKIGDLEGFAAGVRRTIENERQALEDTARLVTRQTARHAFRQKTALLTDFAREYDGFINKYGVPLAGSSGGAAFSVYVAYIRGVAAHYGNDPQTLDTLLSKVADDVGVQANETPDQRDKRRVVAYYFLGVSESNFANFDKGVEHFQYAIDLEKAPKDLLSRLVAAEAAAMGNRAVDALAYLEQVDQILKELNDQYVAATKPLPIAFRRHGYRASLIRANMMIGEGSQQWNEAIALLRAVPDPHEYYAMATLAQLLISQNPSSPEARDKFRDSYTSIRDLGHLHSVNEVRSKILLLLTAGMCAQYADGYTGMLDEHLSEAEGLLGNLPKRGQQTCTVFSPVSKRNETSAVISSHIESIRRGVVLSS